jgi:hypothetical protein
VVNKLNTTPNKGTTTMNMQTPTPQPDQIARISHKAAVWRKRALKAEGQVARLSNSVKAEDRPRRRMRLVKRPVRAKHEEENLRELALASYRDR